MTSTIKIQANLDQISENYKGILLDFYGVFWGGNEIGVLPGCKEVMENLVSKGKIIGILSNTTQLSQKEIEKLKNHGLFEGKHFHFFITSGDVARNILLNDTLPFPTPLKKFYSFGEAHPKFSSHQTIFADTSYEETQDISEADFIYISIPHIKGEDQTDPEVFIDKVYSICPSKLPMLCTNPDCFAHEGIPPKAIVRQGSIGAIYERLGGKVIYLGKPSEIMFSIAKESFLEFKITKMNDILMVGDTPETDIRGASKFGIDSALIIKTGIMADRLSKNTLEDMVKAFQVHDIPTYFIEGLA